jgi:hypothetical protein
MRSWSACYLPPCRKHLLGALESESPNVGRDSLALVAIEIDKVLRASVKLNDSPAWNSGIDQLALGVVGELGELGGGRDETAIGNGSALEEGGDRARDIVSGHCRRGVGAAVVVEDANGDVGAWSGKSRDAAGESDDAGSDDGGELHFEDVGWLLGWFEGEVSVLKRQEMKGGLEEKTKVLLDEIVAVMMTLS